jgi:predicted kinase
MKTKLPIFILPYGIPGSGKSTWIENLIREVRFMVVSPDKIRQEMCGDISDHSKEKEVWKKVFTLIQDCLISGKDVILDATNLKIDRLEQNFFKKLPECNILFKIFKISPEEAKRRIKKDLENKINRSNVPDNIIDNMYKTFNENLEKVLKKYETF